MAERAIVSTPKTLADLVKAVRETLIAGEGRIDRAYLESYRATGFLIDAHILLFKERAGYGEKVIPQLAATLGVGDRLLYRCLRFVRAYPILSARTELGWSHYRVLLDVADKSERHTLAGDATKADLFNYRAELIRVVDGDTVWVRIYQRPRQWVKQKLRLRGLDCPEMNTPEGKAAKRFVDELVAKTSEITINTTKPDKYDRYLADVILHTDAGDELFLNNSLLENGHAVRKDAWEFSDWEPDLLK